MGTTIRCRFVALDLAPGWIELRRQGGWTLKHPERRGELTLSMFPVAEGVTMDLPTLQALSREHERFSERLGRRVPKSSPFYRRSMLLDETAWLQESVFCFATSVRTERPNGDRGPFAWQGLEPTVHTREWTVSDGTYVLEATLHEYDEEHFAAGVDACDAMMRSVRFEGPS
jgi:hypothetical protein